MWLLIWLLVLVLLLVLLLLLALLLLLLLAILSLRRLLLRSSLRVPAFDRGRRSFVNRTLDRVDGIGGWFCFRRSVDARTSGTLYGISRTS